MPPVPKIVLLTLPAQGLETLREVAPVLLALPPEQDGGDRGLGGARGSHREARGRATDEDCPDLRHSVCRGSEAPALGRAGCGTGAEGVPWLRIPLMPRMPIEAEDAD